VDVLVVQELALWVTVTSLNSGWRSASRPPISTEVRVPSSSLLITSRSMIRTVPSATSAVSAGAISPVNPLPGKCRIATSTGPMLMASTPFPCSPLTC
jgi:hypothetical protein